MGKTQTLSAVILLLSLICTTGQRIELQRSQQHEKGYTISYELVSSPSTADEVINFYFESETPKGELEIQFGDPLSLFDILELKWSDGFATLTDKHSTGVFSHRSFVDSSQDFQLQKQQFDGKALKVEFSRKLITADVKEDVQISLGAAMIFIITAKIDYIPESQTFAHVWGQGAPKHDNRRHLDDTAELSNSVEVFANNVLTLQWEIDAAAGTVVFRIKTNFQGWVGIGFGSVMSGTDMNIAQIISGATTISDYKGNSATNPTRDTTQNLELLGYSLANNEQVVKFKRSLSTGDTAGDSVLAAGDVTWIAAYSTTAKTIVYHDTNRKSFAFKFCAGKNCKAAAGSSSLIAFTGFIMIVLLTLTLL